MRRLLCSMALAALFIAYPVRAANAVAHPPCSARKPAQPCKTTTTKATKVDKAKASKPKVTIHAPSKVVATSRLEPRAHHRANKLSKINTPPAKTAPRTVTHLRRIVVPAPMRGSHESLLRQNTIADAEGLERIADNDGLADMVESKDLVALPASKGLLVNPGMPLNRRYCRRWTARFLTDLAAIHQQRFKKPLEVTSAVRTVENQRELLKINGNAAPAEGDVASPHLTGAAIDIAKKGLSISEIAWMRAWLMPLQQAGKIDVEEEFVQSCFHIAVYQKYLPPPAKKSTPTKSKNLEAKNTPPTTTPTVIEVKAVRPKLAATHTKTRWNSRKHRNIGTTLASKKSTNNTRGMG